MRRGREFLRRVRRRAHRARSRSLAVIGKGPLRSDPLTGYSPPTPVDRYRCWLGVNRFTPRVRRRLVERLAATDGLPTISVVMPVYDPPPDLLRAAVRSVQDQVFTAWELCIADDASTDSAVGAVLEDLSGDPRIRIARRSENGGISAATNTAAGLATGEFLLFLDHDDELELDALGEVALAIAENEAVDMAYSDTDKVDEQGRRYDPAFKPDWSPELLLTYMYCGQPLVVRRSLYEEVGGMRLGFEGSQDHDLALRISERARVVHHIPKVLYHWRAIAGSTAISGNEKPHSFEAGRRAVQEALERRGSNGVAVQPDWAREGGNSLFHHEFPDEGPPVAIVIANHNRLDLLRRCVESLRTTTYRNFRIYIADDASDDPETVAYLVSLDDCHVLDVGIPGSKEGFNFARLCNAAAEQVEGEFIVFLNNDTEVLEPRWLSRMVGYAQLQGVGAVGGRLVYPDGRIQHAGVVHGLHDGLAGHAFKLLEPPDFGYLGHVECARNCLAVTAACMLVPRDKFLVRGGFDGQRYDIAYNDPDYCYRLVRDGLRVVYAPGATLLHREGATRGFVDDPRTVAAFRDDYEGLSDRYHNPNLSLDNERHEVAPRHVILAAPPPVRTLVFSHNLNREGAPKVLQDALLDLRNAGVIDPVVVSPSDGPLRLEYEAQSVDVTVTDLPLHGPDIASYEQAVEELCELMRSERADVVWANTLLAFPAIDAAWTIGVPSVWLVHESEGWRSYFDFVEPPVARRALASFAYPYRVVFTAHATRAQFEELNSRRNFAVVHNAMPLAPIDAMQKEIPAEECRSLLGVKDDEFVLLSIGTVCDRKGQADLVEAVVRMDDQERDGLRVLIVGDLSTEYASRLVARVESLDDKVRRHIDLVGSIDAPEIYYRAANALVVTSSIESYPRVILEAMAFGLPIITTPVFGISEQVCEGVNAVVFPPSDVAALRSSIVQLQNDPVQRQALAAQSPWVLRSLPSYDRMLRLYGELLQEAYFTADEVMLNEDSITAPSARAAGTPSLAPG